MANKTKTKNLVARFISDTSKWNTERVKKDLRIFQNQNKQVGNSFKSVGKQADALSSKVGMDSNKGLAGSFSNVKSSVSGLITKYGGLALATIGVTGALLAIKRGLTEIIRAGMQAEDAIVKLTVLFGNDAPRALKTYQKALEFSVITPFDPRDVVDAAVVAGQYGADAFTKGLYGAKSDIITLVADMAAFSNQTMEQAATALMRGDLALLEKYGAAGRRAYATAKKAGELGSAEFIQTFVREMSKVPLWMGMAEKKSQTMSGIWSTIQGNVGLIFTHLSGAALGGKAVTFWTKLKSIVKDFSDWFGGVVADMKPYLIDYGKQLGMGFEAIWSFGKAIYAMFKPIFKLIGIVAFVYMRAWMFGIKLVLGASTALFKFVAKIYNTFWKMLDNVLGVSSALKSIFEFSENIIIKVQILGVFLKNLFKSVGDYIIRLIERLPTIFKVMAIEAQAFFEKGKKSLITKLGFGEDGAVTKTTSAIDKKISVVFSNLKKSLFTFGDQNETQKTPQNITNNNSTSVRTDNSSKTTNVYNPGQNAPEWLVVNPYDVSGSPVGVR